MDNLLLYLLKVSAGTSLIYICYLLLFRKDTFYVRNRIFLILALLVPTIFPAIKIPVISDISVPVETTYALDSILFPDNSFATTIPSAISTDSFNYNRLVLLIYFTIAGLLLLRVFISLISTYTIIKKGVFKNSKFPKVIITDNQLPPFSFFPYAVIPAENYRSGNYGDILEHEFAHIRQGHTFDLILSELFIAFQWFNPFIWLIKRSIILNHEYLADHVSIRNNENVKEYQYRLLNFQTGMTHISLAHNFNSSIKNRIIMINKKPTCRLARLKNIIILPVVAFVVYAFASPEYHYVTPGDIASGDLTIFESPVIEQLGVKGIVLKEDETPLSFVTIVDIQTGKGIQTVSDGRFVLNNVPKDVTLQFSCIGYKDKTLKADFNSEMVIKMEVDPDYKGTVMTLEATFIHEGQNVKIRVNDDKGMQSLVVVDGKISSSKGEAIIKRDDIGSLNVLKGQEATDKYGEQGKNGVIELTTKQGASESGIITPQGRPSPIVVIDGVISEKNIYEARKDLAYDFGIVNRLSGTEAIDKYGEKAADGVYEITTRKKALEMGLRPPFPRLAPEDYPTFQNQSPTGYAEWIASHARYPAGAVSKNSEGWVSVNFTVDLDGSVRNVVSTLMADPLLSNEIISVIKSSPKWDPPKNPKVDEPFTSSITLKFRLPDKITTDAPFVVVEEMPQYPGGDAALLDYIKNNTRYPEAAISEKIQGRVILRFIVSKEGKAEGISVLKGVDPLLDAEATRVVSLLSGFKPGMQGGKPVDVWYMVPVSFSLPEGEPLFSQSSEKEILKFIGQNTAYPQAAKNSFDTGKVYVEVKMNRGGTIKECNVFNEKEEISLPLIPGVVIVGYDSSTGLQSNAGLKKVVSNEHKLLKAESIRVANKLGELNIPEWKDRDMEFAFAIKFVLR